MADHADPAAAQLAGEQHRQVFARFDPLGGPFVREVSWYLNRPERRSAARELVAQKVSQRHPRVIVAHSLGRVVTYEALWSKLDWHVDLLVQCHVA